MYGGIDLGGTKIEACLFDSGMRAIQSRRVPTPRNAYADLLDAVLEQCAWLEGLAGEPRLPIGLGIPGLIDPRTGLSTTANLPATGQPMQTNLAQRLGRLPAIENDCKCFAISEAHEGAGAGFDVVFALSLGTGVGGGICRGGELLRHHDGLSGEVGHLPLPAHLVQNLRLPLVACGCGRLGCYETLISGPGLSRLGRHLESLDLSAEAIVRDAAEGQAKSQRVIEVWLSLLTELLRSVQFTVDPDAIVLGGGLGAQGGLPEQLRLRLRQGLLPAMRLPEVAISKFGALSGARGAALLARHANADGGDPIKLES